MDTIKPRMVKKVKWKNIFGLVAFVVVVFVIITVYSFVNSFLKGDCVEKEYLKACFSVDKSNLAKHEVAVITIDVTNIGKIPTNATLSLTVSPNLLNMSATTQAIGVMNPEDSVKREFRIASKDEVGKFKIEVDMNRDGVSDKDIFLTVK